MAKSWPSHDEDMVRFWQSYGQVNESYLWPSHGVVFSNMFTHMIKHILTDRQCPLDQGIFTEPPI
jgi:hypothetical protein